MPHISLRAQLTQVSHTQALNIYVEQPMDNSESSAEHTQNQPVILVSFASTTQDRADIAVPPPVGQGVPWVPPVWVPPLQITSVTSKANVAASMTSLWSGTSFMT